MVPENTSSQCFRTPGVKRTVLSFKRNQSFIPKGERVRIALDSSLTTVDKGKLENLEKQWFSTKTFMPELPLTCEGRMTDVGVLPNMYLLYTFS